jgi:hypothetical protein
LDTPLTDADGAKGQPSAGISRHRLRLTLLRASLN